MLNIGDTFIQNGLTYVVKGKDGAGRPVSSCKPEDVEKYKKVDEPKEKESVPEENQQEEILTESKQGELPFVDVPNSTPAEEEKKNTKKGK